MVQDSDNGVEKVIQYVSHTLSTTQRKWATIEKEVYAVVYCINKLKPYLYGVQFNVYTDHKPLLSLFTKSMNNTTIQIWGSSSQNVGRPYPTDQGNVKSERICYRVLNMTPITTLP